MEPQIYEQLRIDRENLPTLLARLSSIAGDHRASRRATVVLPPPAADSSVDRFELSRAGSGAAAVLDRLLEEVVPGLPAIGGGRYLGFVTGGVTPAALLGDWVASLVDQNPISRLDSALPLALEDQAITMLRELLGLPATFRGSFVSGATMSNFVGLALGRQWAGHQLGVDVAEHGLPTGSALRVLSAAAHSSVGKACAMLGLGRDNVVPIPTQPGREAIEVAALAAERGRVDAPTIVVVNAGTVNTGDFDDIVAVAALRDEFDFWLHVDGAFGGFASVSPEFADLLKGWSSADSICVDLHKWLNVPYDSAAVFTRHRELQGQVFANSSAYLGKPGSDPEPIHLVPENSHRWRALPALCTMAAYGSEGYREIVERDCRHARILGGLVAESDEFELLAQVRLNIVCFTPRAAATAAQIEEYIARVRDDGRTFVTPTLLAGRPAVRAAFCSWETTATDVALVWQGLLAAARTAGYRAPIGTAPDPG